MTDQEETILLLNVDIDVLKIKLEKQERFNKFLKKEMSLQDLVKDKKQKKWMLVTAIFRHELYVVEEMDCLGSGEIYPTRFRGCNFSPDSEHVTDVAVQIFSSLNKFNEALKSINYTTT